jgi:hypothetical protein
MDVAGADQNGEEHVDAVQGHRQSTWKKSQASVVAAWVRRNSGRPSPASAWGSASAVWRPHTANLLDARPVWGTFIGGRFVDAAGAPTFDVLEAATGRTMASVVAATARRCRRGGTERVLGL